MIDGLHAQLMRRAAGRCECCGDPFNGRVEVDHAFGRPPRAEEAMATCWVLLSEHHYSKTRNSPDASHWLRKFATHCDKHGYAESANRARARLDFVDTRRMLGSALGTRR